MGRDGKRWEEMGREEEKNRTNKQNKYYRQRRTEHNSFASPANHKVTACSPPCHLHVQDKHAAVSKHRAKIPSFLNSQKICRTLRWMYVLTLWSLALLCSASSVAAVVPFPPESQPSPLNIDAAPAIMENIPEFLPERHFELNEAAPEKPKLAPLSQPHPRGRSLGTDWCTSGKSATGVHTLPRGSTCIFNEHVTIAASTSLALSSAQGSGDVAILSGNYATSHFVVYGNLTLTDLIVEKGKSSFAGGALHVRASATADACVHLVRQ